MQCKGTSKWICERNVNKNMDENIDEKVNKN